MRKLIVLVLLLAAANLFAHGGHVHNVLGTVKSIASDDVVIARTDGSSITITLAPTTKYEGGAKSDLVAGVRVSVYLANDGKTGEGEDRELEAARRNGDRAPTVSS